MLTLFKFKKQKIRIDLYTNILSLDEISSSDKENRALILNSGFNSHSPPPHLAMGSYANQLFQSDSQQEGESPHTVRTEEVLIKTLVDGIVSVGVSRGEIVNTRGWKTCDRFRSQLKGQREEVVIGSWGPKVVGLKGLLAKALTRSILSELYSPPHSNSHLLCSVSVSHWRIQSEARGQGGP